MWPSVSLKIPAKPASQLSTSLDVFTCDQAKRSLRMTRLSSRGSFVNVYMEGNTYQVLQLLLQKSKFPGHTRCLR